MFIYISQFNLHKLIQVMFIILTGWGRGAPDMPKLGTRGAWWVAPNDRLHIAFYES